jgi:hypothetical protein
MEKAVELKQENYTIQVKYSPEAVEKKLMKFISKSGDEFVISADEMIAFLIEQVNVETLAPAFVEMTKVNVVEVGRQIKCKLTADLKKGQEININYSHPYPLEFALIEEAAKIAKIDMSIPRFEITKEYLDEVKAKIKPEQTQYIEKFYKSFKNVKI